MEILLYIGLFISTLVTIYLLLVPLNDYDTTPFGLTKEFLEKKLESFFADDNSKEKLSIINKSTSEIISYAFIFGVGFGALATILTVKPLGIFSLAVGVVAMIIGVMLTRLLIENEFKRWQNELFQGVPPLTNFMPAFLDVGALTTKESMAFTVPFLPEPLKSEIQTVINRISRTGEAKQALDSLSLKAKHPVIDNICLRLGMAWDNKVDADMFSDLIESIDNENEKAAARATVTKSGLFALIAVVAMLGALPIFGYPAMQFVMDQISGGMGI